MVGKIKRTRQKLHQDAVKVDHSQSDLEKPPLPAEVKGLVLPGISKDFDFNQRTNKSDNIKGISLKSSFPAGIFAGTKITPEALVQTLKYDEPSKSTASSNQTGGGEKKQQSKKEKMKERRERWLNKISAIKLAKEQQVAQARRKATPVVGDMRQLVDALPELSQLTATSKPTATRSKAKAGEKKKPSSVNFSKMKPAQKRKLVETETAWFSQALKNPTLKANPLAAITDHLRKRLKQEEEQS
ncbi:protein FAM207A [Sardina pilchardus]|uniref:protein FAM207A n=1 Tax=Sardina pilchardus TaxID=27697 RepID=UPI002E123447